MLKMKYLQFLSHSNLLVPEDCRDSQEFDMRCVLKSYLWSYGSPNLTLPNIILRFDVTLEESMQAMTEVNTSLLDYFPEEQVSGSMYGPV